ncbi:DNA-binding anti-repressor SinI [Salibacterium salarium]|uniref:DNA-binding anti-repressor SinI n=1 Tax=Salibacterium salarium TaxID=284579 RepID=A0A3R9RDY8_9BACI|nr:anti-repressor SinI family protein [Salibacterium salarium]RSL33356.1 DNA-binding anti-repressor SinI [Salibacterium salarium]
MNRTLKVDELDREWVELMKMAKELGISKKEVQFFLQKNAATNNRSAVN